MQVLAQAFGYGVGLALVDFALHFGESEMDDVVMVDFLAGQAIAEIEPHAMKHFDFLGRKARRMRAEIENIFVARRRKNFQSHARPGLWHLFPGETNLTRLVLHRGFRRAADHNRARLKIHSRAQNTFPEIVRGGHGKSYGFAFFFRHGEHFGEEQLFDRAEQLIGGEDGDQIMVQQSGDGRVLVL